MLTIKNKFLRKLGPALLSVGVVLGLLVGGSDLTPQRAITVEASQSIPITGIPVPSMASFDRMITELMIGYDFPGGAVAVVKDGRLVYARGFGLADKEQNQLVQPEALFRIASISKPITAVAALKLMEEGRLNLEAKAFCKPGTTGNCILDHLQPPPGATVDDRIYNVTIRMLLQHTGGWDRDRSGDPMFMPTTKRAAEALGQVPPASCETVIRFMLGQRLDFDPGTYYAYSNLGYCILGRIIEKVAGQSYEEYVKANVLKPMEIARMRIGRTLLEGRAEGEVRYYGYPGQPLAREPVFPHIPGPVPWPYGGFYLEAMDSLGGWIASAIDLLRFVTAVDGRRPPAFLKPETVRLMVSRPELSYWRSFRCYYGMGWNVCPVQDDATWSHNGSLAGTSSILVREAQTGHRLAWAALFNSRPSNWRAFTSVLDRALWQAANGVTEWPTHDLFGQYP